MATLGMWFIGVGVANALLGGIAVRINDPMIRGLAIERVLGLPWGVWLALAALAVACVIQDHTRLGRYIYALGGGEELAALSGIPVARVRIAAFTLAGVFYAARRRARRGAARPRQRPDRPRAGCSPPSPPSSSAAPRCPAAQGGVLQTLVGVLIVVVLANGMVLMGVPPERPDQACRA